MNYAKIMMNIDGVIYNCVIEKRIDIHNIKGYIVSKRGLTLLKIFLHLKAGM